MNTFGDDLKKFLEKHPYKTADIGGVKYRYILTDVAVAAGTGSYQRSVQLAYAEEVRVAQNRKHVHQSMLLCKFRVRA